MPARRGAATIMTQAEISVIDDGTQIAFGPAILVSATSFVQSVPIPNAPGTSAFIRVRGVRASGVLDYESFKTAKKVTGYEHPE